MTPARRVRATAPVRICDAGGWTDTWFAGHGTVCHLAVDPGVEVTVDAWPAGTGPARLTIDAPGEGPHVLLEAAVDEAAVDEAAVDEHGVEHDLALTVTAGVPAGSAMGTSASTTVATLAALGALAGRSIDPTELARAAHRVETERLGLQSGVQDQLAAAFGGVNRVEVDAYPAARVVPLALQESTWDALDSRLLVVYLGRPHRSSAVHERVIAELGAEGPTSPRLEALRRTARAAADALEADDLDAYGAALVANTAAQRQLAAGLVSTEAEAVIDLAARRGATGWKVNGAGGDGGSVAVLAPDLAARSGLEGALGAHRPGWEVLLPRLSRTGVRVWDPVGF